MALIVLNNNRSLIVEIISKLARHWVLLWRKVKRFDIGYENISGDKLGPQIFVGNDVPFWSIEIDHKIWHWMLTLHLTFEVHLCFEQGLSLVDALRKACNSVIRLLLLIHVVNNEEDWFEGPVKINLRFTDGYLLRTVGQSSIWLIFEGHPLAERRLADLFVDEVFDGRICSVSNSLNIHKVNQVTKGFNHVFHLKLHYFSSVVVPVKAQNS